MRRTHHWAFSSDETACRTITPLPSGIRADRCRFCAEPIASVLDAYVEFYDAPTMTYPVHWNQLVVVHAHAQCGPDCGYPISFASLLEKGLDGPAGWIAHLRMKSWWAETFEHDLRASCKFARRLAEKEARAKERAARAPQIPENPRSISRAMRTRVLERDGFRCRRCGRGRDHGVVLEVDHILPVAAGGRAIESNLQTLCEDCNGGKSDRAPHAQDLRPFADAEPAV
jgi:5-methylcytosine-specific restriction endonuclease McrA